jgi:hypothetical protein
MFIFLFHSEFILEEVMVSRGLRQGTDPEPEPENKEVSVPQAPLCFLVRAVMIVPVYLRTRQQ